MSAAPLAPWSGPASVAIGQALEIMTGLPAASRPLPEDPSLSAGAVEGRIELSGSVEGFVALRLAHDLAVELVTSMVLRQDPLRAPPLEDEVLDGVGELANIVAGQAKGALSTGGRSISISLPNVTVGGEVPSAPWSTWLAFEIEGRPAIVQIGLDRPIGGVS